MWALAALGLEADADERAVKRAYAQRLKVTRPDEDASGFQKLRETYDAALRFVRTRAQDDEEEDDEEEDEARPADPPAPGAEIDPAPPPNPAPAPPRPAAPAVAPLAPEDIGFTLDVGAFAMEMRARAQRDSFPAFADWLERIVAAWPIGARAEIAPRLLPALADPLAAPTLAHFDLIARVFGFDDVRARVDPLRFQRERTEAAARETRWRRPRVEAALAAIAERGARLAYIEAELAVVGGEEFRLWLRGTYFAELFRPDAREYLFRRVEAARLSRAAVDRYANLLTGPGAAIRARLLRPLPFYAGAMQTFVDALDGGRVDALSYAVDPKALKLWRDRATGGFWSKVRLAWAALVLVGIIARALTGPDAAHRPAPPDPITVDLTLADQLREQKRFPEAVSAYDLALKHLNGDVSPEGQRNAAAAIWRRTDAYGETNDLAAMQRSALEMIERFGASADLDVRAKLGQTLFDAGDYFENASDREGARWAYERIIDLFRADDVSPLRWVKAAGRVKLAYLLDAAKDPEGALRALEPTLAGEPFAETEDDRIWLSTALVEKLKALDALGREADAVAVWGDLERRFSSSDEPRIAMEVAHGLYRRALLATAADAPAIYDVAIRRYGESADERLRYWVARCIVGKATALSQTGRRSDALAELDALIARYPDPQEGDIGDILTDARSLRGRLAKPPP